MSSIAIQIKDLCKIYKLYDSTIDRVKESFSLTKKKFHKEHYALNNVSFSVEKGDLVGIVGTNGSGKSTLLKIISGVLTHSSGEIVVNGKVAALLELGAGFNMEYTGIENIFLNATMMGFRKDEIKKKLDDILNFAELGEYIYQPVKTYSSGMFARLAFSVAINVEPDILIVDEALSVGDMYFQAKCMTKMKEMFESGVTVLYVSHDLNSIKSLCNKAIYLENGILIDYDDSEKVVDSYAKNIRDQMTRATQDNQYREEDFRSVDSLVISKEKFKDNPSFHEKVKYFRQGTQEAMLTELEVLGEDGYPLVEGCFNEKITIRMYVSFNEDCQISIGYHIRDKQNIEYLGSNTLIENIGEIKGSKGQKLLVEFKTRLPLVEGVYNFSTVLSTTTIKNRAAVFVDYTENSYIFSMAERKPYRLWNKVYVENSVKVKSVED